MSRYAPYYEANRKAWNAMTAVHKNTAFYDLAGFKHGNTSLQKIELEELGNVTGKSLLHLQCHFGMDTMSWSRLGAKATGVDLSDDAIALAKEIAVEIKTDTQFICSNVYDLKDHLDSSFDIVFTSYGAIGWLPDLNQWAEMVSYYLKPGGIFYIVEFHPVLWMMDETFSYIKYNYFNASVIPQETFGTYADPGAPIQTSEYGWNHPFTEIVNALINQKLQIQHFNEFSFSPFNCFNNLEQGDDGNWYIKGMEKKMPVLYSIKAVKAT